LQKYSGMIDYSWQARTELHTGTQGIERLRNAEVLVLGLGGVGAMAAEMLCRAGIGKMTLVDGDVVMPTNRNRQIPALKSTEGRHKTGIMEERLRDINPDVEITTIAEYVKDQRMIDVLSSRPFDYVVDAIDTLSPKIYLLLHAMELGLNVVSSMGCGGKSNPDDVKIADISETYQCAFAADIRKRLRRLGITTGFKTVFSSEQLNKSSVIHSEDEKNKKSIVGTISYMPPLFGCFCASVVIRDILYKN
jgi:tRNA threonylcarbamoyladenosine dehydratase